MDSWGYLRWVYLQEFFLCGGWMYFQYFMENFGQNLPLGVGGGFLEGVWLGEGLSRLFQSAWQLNVFLRPHQRCIHAPATSKGYLEPSAWKKIGKGGWQQGKWRKRVKIKNMGRSTCTLWSFLATNQAISIISFF